MLRTVLALAVSLVIVLLTACASIDSPLDDGYQPGDVTATATELQARYCATADPYQRAVLLALFHRLEIDIPERGACTDLLELIGPGEVDLGLEIDVEAAEDDQERFDDAHRDTAPIAGDPGAE